MDRRMWCTKEDVLKDLEVASGRRVASVDESFFVVGERPPPPQALSNEDDDFDLHFGEAATLQKSDKCDETGPDLKGITSMLRMVQDYENSSQEDLSNVAIDTPKSNNTIVISKLNPNVKEFIPRFQGVASQNGSHTNTNIIAVKPNLQRIETANEITATPCTKIEAIRPATMLLSSKNSILNTVPTASSSISAQTTNAELPKAMNKQIEYQEMAAMLKNNISAVKNDSFEEKRKTNVAIVNLLKLYAQQNQVSEPSKPLKLLPPQFFETSKASEFNSYDENDFKKSDSSIEQNKYSLLNVVEVSNDMSLEQSRDQNKLETDINVIKDKNYNINNVTSKRQSTNTEELDEMTSLTPEMADTGIADGVNHNSEAKPDEIEESVKKVNSWLENKPYNTKDKFNSTAGVYLSPVSYKRKDPTTCKSPSEIADKKISKPSDTAYKPSKYADELLQKYQQRNEKKVPPLNIWEKLEQDLKKKDAEIASRKKKSME